MSAKSLYLWVRLAKDSASPSDAETVQLKAEVSRLKADLKRANEERDMLKMARAYFPKLELELPQFTGHSDPLEPGHRLQ